MRNDNGYIVISVIVFASVFALILGGLTGFIFVQNSSQRIKDNRERAIQIAEAGLDYYKWHLSHFPDDLYNGQGSTSTGPYEIVYEDPEVGEIGTISLDINGEVFCGQTNSVEVVSTGWTNERPDITRTVYGKYARPSVAEYAYVINSNVWAGADRVISGPYHSNGGIRMDGTNESLVTSAVEDWICTSSFGCSPNTTQDGVFGAGPNSALWDFPIQQVDFAGIQVDLTGLKALAQSDGYYLGPSGDDGYRLDFQSNGTVNVYRIDDADGIWGYSTEDGWHGNYHYIDDETFIGNVTPPADCPIVFVEDELWIGGDINGKFTVASADLISGSNATDVLIADDIEYVNGDGEDGLTVVAEDNLLLSFFAPNNLDVEGIYIAQGGRFGRNHYTTSGSYDVPSSWDSYVLRSTFDLHGTIVSNGRVGTKWSCGGTYCSGYDTRTTTFDRDLSTSPPPLTPAFDTNYEYVEWREES